MPESPLDKARHYKALQQSGLSVKQICKSLKLKYQEVRSHLTILRLPTYYQQQIHLGKSSWLKTIKQYQNGKLPPPPPTPVFIPPTDPPEMPDMPYRPPTAHVVIEPIEEPVVDDTLSRIRTKRQDALRELKNAQSGIVEGYVYVVTNPAWVGCVKIGSALDYEARLASFQTYDPHRAYEMPYWKYFADRKHIESDVHEMFASKLINGEWFSITVQEAIDAIESIAPGG